MKYEIIKILLFMIMSTALPAQSIASTSGPATITQLLPSTTNFTFGISINRASPAACAASTPSFWVIDNSTSQGQGLVATIMTAFAMGKQISVWGTGNCPTYQSSVEQVLYLTVAQ